MPTLFEDLEARGIVKQVTSPELGSILESKPLSLYCGFDPTSDSLHVGSLLPLLTLRRFQLAGHRPIAVVGGATGMIGDPSGKSQERNLLNDAQIAHNLAGIRSTIERFLDFKGPNAAVVVNNGEWFKGFSFIEFLRDIGKHFTVNHMMAKESVRARLEDREHGISYTEFSYMLLQAYDFYFLQKNQGCKLQIGGSDQWGNITAGIELIRRMRAASEEPLQDTETFGLTHPLVSKADGTKFGKTESGTVWLDAKKTSPYRFYQFFVQASDADVMEFLKFFTFLSLERLAEIEHSLKTEPAKRLAQTTLAQEVTRLVHGAEELARAEKATQALFGTGIWELDEATLLDVLAGAPSTKKSKDLLNTGMPLIDLLVDTQLCPSKGQARKDVTAGGVYVNNERVSDSNTLVGLDDLLAGNHLVLRKGKKNYHLVSFE
ncbi:tyrosine--tRNA ligase [Bdellovibrionota bacterium FG-1]